MTNESRSLQGINVLQLHQALRRLSDLICVENDLSIIRNPKPGKGKHYGAWLPNSSGVSATVQQMMLKLAGRPVDFAI
ncbi:hypothetical protein LJC04_02680 [Ruminococcaceae bacterium OttesenSCG-928-O06]|nr:hypothetical protein [Ruminococcaceae bacterium OttesenSCG-928-O06]